MLYLFTATYPYGSAECFLEDELTFLAPMFGNITIVPLGGVGKPTRLVPDNCVVLAPVIKSKKWKFFHGLFCRRTFLMYFRDFFGNHLFISWTRFREWLASYFNTNCAIKSPQIKEIEKRLQEDDVCYFYWGKGLNTLSVFWGHKAKFVSRFHGEWDLWEESADNYAPIRKEVVKGLNIAVFISQKGELYFRDRYPFCKAIVSRLGSKDCGVGRRSSDGVIRIVSCSYVYPLKRVPLIYQALQEMDQKIQWTHIGDGESFEELKAMVAQNKKSNLKIELLGSMKHTEVLNYYSNHPVDVFINVSTSEGIPVSIMEAISFDIPIVATNVGGTSEIVNDETGVLVTADPSPSEVATAINDVVKKKISPRSFWEKTFNAETNYTSFAKGLIELSTK